MEYLGVPSARPRTHQFGVRAGASLAALTLAFVVSACSAPEEDRDPASAPSGTPTDASSTSPPEALSKVLQPQRPGEPNQTLGADATVDSPEWNDVDMTFMQMMIPHHGQALEMSELALTRAEDAQVQAIARRIRGSQGPEIISMSAWLQGRGLETPRTLADLAGMDGMDGMDGMEMDASASMAGMLSPSQMKELAEAKGSAFDRLFLTGMIQHHEGAVGMAESQLTAGSDLIASEVASEIAFGQKAEIQRMEAILAGL